MGDRPRLLGVLLCYNDADILDAALHHLASNGHDIIAWDHGSDDDTPRVLDAWAPRLVERRLIPRTFDFYQLYQTMSAHLIRSYVQRYDWISWPDQDEILEGPARDRSYGEYITEAVASPWDWIQFDNYNYWLTEKDDAASVSPVERIRHYCLFPDCAPRIRSWRARATNIRMFNHNPPEGTPHPVRFRLRHYSARTYEQLDKRIFKDRSDLQRGAANYHYNNMKAQIDRTRLRSDQLHFDDGVNELDPAPKFNWRTIYGTGPAANR